MLSLLIRTKLLTALFGLRNYKTALNRSKIFRYAILLFFPAWIFVTSSNMFKAWFMLPGFDIQILYNILSLMLFGLFFILFVSSLSLAFHYYFLDTDLNWLFALPVKKKHIFQVKFIELCLSNSAIFYILGIPLLAAALTTLHAGPIQIILTALGCMLFIIIPAGMGSILAIVLAMLFPVKRTRNLTSIIIGIIIVGIWALFQLIKIHTLDPYAAGFDPGSLQRLSGLLLYNVVYLPSNWLLYLMNMEKSLQIWLFFACLLLCAVILNYSVTFILNAVYTRELKLIKNTRENRGLIKHKNGTTARYSSFIKGSFVLVIRDIKLLFRDSRFVTQMFFYIGIFIVFPFMLQDTFDGVDQHFIIYKPFIFLFFATTIMAGGISSKIIPLEKKSFPFNLVSPLPASEYISSKVVTGFGMTIFPALAGFSIVLLQTKILNWSVLQIIYLLFWNTFGASALGVLFGILFANFEWENPRQMLLLKGNIMLNFALIFYMIATAALFVLLFYIINSYYAALVYSLLHAGFILVFMYFSVKKMKTIEWRF